jgi:coproporphyrinogen III oxidase
MDLFEQSAAYFQDLQGRILDGLEALDGEARFLRDRWQRPEPDGPRALGGGGHTCVMEDGAVFERAAVNFSLVHGTFTEDFARTMPGEGLAFRATGISLVLHPRNPYVPTVHMNLRRLSRESGGWFGGGADLTPIYLDPADARHFHRCYFDACEAHPGIGDYPRFKQWCDDYFFLPHRDEARGIGGVFFDHLTDRPEETFAFIKSVGEAFLPSYLPIAERHKDRPYGDREQLWQRIRRGRYVEFNLIHDRGTTFGLKTGGRTESILVSMPLHATWRYQHTPEPGSPEAALLDSLKPRDWLA